ncbi:MAG: sensor histidine kinase [Candidatus Limiplasma sp.]|nr:sensor histidine kinase [Candidatus Limiplasma sp.]
MPERKEGTGLHKLILENKFYLKLMLTYCLVIFLGFGLTSYLVTSNMVEILTNMESRFDSEVIQKVLTYSDERYQDINNIFVRLYQKQYFNNNTSIVDFINPVREAQRNNSSKAVSITSYLQDTCSANTAIADILLIDYHDRQVYFCSNIHNRDVSLGYDFFRLDFIGSGQVRNSTEIVPNYIPDYISSASINNFPVVSYKLYLFDENAVRFDQPLGMAVVNMRADFFASAYKDSSSFLGQIYVIERGGVTLFDSSHTMTGQPFSYGAFQATGLTDLVTNSRFIVNKRYSEKSGFTFVDIVDKRIIEKETDRIRLNINNMIAVCIAVALAIGLVSAAMLSKRIKALVHNMKDVESGKLDTHIVVGSKDEIGYLEQSFSTMCAKLAAYIQNVYVFEIRTKTAELNALQAQIDPHFLFNTLESIRMTAQINKDTQTAKMIHILGNMFRWNIKVKSIIVDLKEEIEYVRSYIELQKLRYNNAFDVTFDLSSQILKLGVLKLTLQPIVENAIQHGLDEGTGGGHITIAGSIRENRLVLSVTDNGKGMDEEKVKAITATLTRSYDVEPTSSIGLSNVHQRNSILFGEGYGIRIFSSIGNGTRVELTLPVMSREEMERYVQGIPR